MSEINIFIKDRAGVSHNIKAPTDISMNLMELIRLYELAEEGTLGICGGMAMCASCQCYIESPHPLPKMEAEEEAMLSEAFHVKENSRLSCQININAKLSGLSLEIAPE